MNSFVSSHFSESHILKKLLKRGYILVFFPLSISFILLYLYFLLFKIAIAGYVSKEFAVADPGEYKDWRCQKQSYPWINSASNSDFKKIVE